MKAPREWKILKRSNNGDEFIRGPDTEPNEHVDVIEKEAFDNVVAELAKRDVALKERSSAYDVEKAEHEKTKHLLEQYKTDIKFLEHCRESEKQMGYELSAVNAAHELNAGALKKAEAEIARLTKERDELIRKERDWKSYVDERALKMRSDYEESLESNRHAVAILAKERDALRAELEQAKQDLKNDQLTLAEISDLKAEKEALQASVEELRSSNEKLLEANKDWEMDYVQESKDNAEFIAKLQAEKVSDQETLARLRERIKELEK